MRVFGWTRDGVLVLVSSFEKGRHRRELEWRVYELEQAYSELKAGYTVSQSKIEELKDEVEKLWKVVSRIPELRDKLEKIYAKISKMKKSTPPYQGKPRSSFIFKTYHE